ncbi:MAG: response regulator [Deferribacteraceae bacterium]|jgi:putative two-component system response regulator|nr:response regulator [Deferribacteraceae bacterium]
MSTNRKKVVVVDDDLTNLAVARDTLAGKYDVFTVPSSQKLFKILEKIAPDLILLDIEMPEMDGYETMEIIKNSENFSEIPVIFLTACIDPASEVRGLNLGAVDYITKPFSHQLLLKRVEKQILFDVQQKELKNYSNNLEDMVKEKAHTIFELQNSILKIVAELVECRDNVTGGHIERTQTYLRLLLDIMREHNLYPEELLLWDSNMLVMSSLLHDVGKISIRDSILLKAGKLTDEEYEEVKKHCTLGMEIIEKIEQSTKENSFLQHAKVFAVSHHERWDGKGYPYGLKGDKIPLQGRMMAIADVYDALTNERPYKRSFSHEESVEIIKRESGTHFDPYLVDLFLKYERNFKEIRTDYRLNTKTETETSGITGISLESLSKLTSGLFKIDGDGTKGSIDKIRRYLITFINALLVHEHYKSEVSQWDVRAFLLSAFLRDIRQKISDVHTLDKTNTLTADELEAVKARADMVMEIIQKIKEELNDENLMCNAEALAYSSYEKWDGTGQPFGLKGEEIPLHNRLMAIIDSYNTLVNGPYNSENLSHGEVVDLIKSQSGTSFDPELVNIFLQCEREFEEEG